MAAPESKTRRWLGKLKNLGSANTEGSDNRWRRRSLPPTATPNHAGAPGPPGPLGQSFTQPHRASTHANTQPISSSASPPPESHDSSRARQTADLAPAPVLASSSPRSVENNRASQSSGLLASLRPRRISNKVADISASEAPKPATPIPVDTGPPLSPAVAESTALPETTPLTGHQLLLSTHGYNLKYHGPLPESLSDALDWAVQHASYTSKKALISALCDLITDLEEVKKALFGSMAIIHIQLEDWALLIAHRAADASADRQRQLVGMRDDQGMTLLALSARCSYSLLMSLLLDFGAETETRNVMGEVPLHHAIRFDNHRGMKLLLARGADAGVGGLMHLARSVGTQITSRPMFDELAAAVRAAEEDARKAKVREEASRRENEERAGRERREEEERKEVERRKKEDRKKMENERKENEERERRQRRENEEREKTERERSEKEENERREREAAESEERENQQKADIEALLVAYDAGVGEGIEGPQSLYAALCWAVERGERALAAALLDRGAMVLPTPADLAFADTKDNSYRNQGVSVPVSTPLHRAIDLHKTRLAEWLLDEFLQRRPSEGELARLVSLTDRQGRTLLALAAREGECGLAIRLLELGASTETTDRLGRTPLHQAARGGKVDALTLLLQRGADATVCDSHGRTALDRAAAGGHHGAAAILREAVPHGNLTSSQVPAGVRDTGLRSEPSSSLPAGVQVMAEPQSSPRGKEKAEAKELASSGVCIVLQEESPTETDEMAREDWDTPLPGIRYKAIAAAKPDSDPGRPADGAGSRGGNLDTRRRLPVVAGSYRDEGEESVVDWRRGGRVVRGLEAKTEEARRNRWLDEREMQDTLSWD